MDPRFMREAIRLSIEGVERNQGGPFGAVVVRGDDIVGRGWNCVTSANDPTAHAEIQAIRDACAKLGTFHLDGCTVYASCEPCPMCLAALYWSRVDAVFYAADRSDAARAGFDDALIYGEIPRPPAERSLVMQQAMRTDALPAFAIWKAKADKTPY
ncbi:MAG: nucleoside deaminase [Planctomycetaceae bacterium]